MNRLALLVTVAMAAFAGSAEEYLNWRSEVKVGNYAEPTNWVDGILPTSPQTVGCIPAAGITVKIPQGGIVETSTVHFLGNFSNANVDRLTIDTTEGRWYKPAAAYLSNWHAFMFCAGGTDHYFNIESISETSGYPLVEFSGGVLHVDTSNAGATWTLESGVFDVWHPDGISAGNSLVIGGSGSRKIHVVLKPGSSLRASALRWRANAKGSSMLIEGGDHAFDGFYCHDAGGRGIDRDEEPVVIAGGHVFASALHVADMNRTDGYSRLILTNDACVGVGRELWIGAGQQNNTGVLDMYASSVLMATNNVLVGCSSEGGGHGELNLRDDVRLLTTQDVQLGRRRGTANPAEAYGQLILSNRASAAVGWSLYVGAKPSSRGLCEINDEATLSTGYSVYVGGVDNDCDTADNVVRLNGGRVQTGSDNEVALSAIRPLVEVNGGELTCGRIVFGFRSGTENAVFRQNGGRSIVKSVVAQSGSSTLELNGGSFATGDIYREGEATVARARLDGVTLELGRTPTRALFDGYESVKLGAGGIVFDQAGNDAPLASPLAAEDGTGTFVKRGWGKLTALASSSHPATVVEEGSLALGAGVTGFGAVCTLAPGTELDVAEASAVAFDSLTLGAADGNPVTLKTSRQATISVADAQLSVGRLFVRLADPLANGAYAVFATTGETAFPDDLVNRVSVANMKAGKTYAFAVVQTDGGSALRLTVSDSAGTTVGWTGGSSSDWSDGGNWEGSAKPGAEDTADFTAAAGRHEIAADVRIAGETSVSVGESAEGRISGDLSALGATLAKSGDGRLVLAGDNADFLGTVTVDGGSLVGETGTAFGAADSLAQTITLRAGTFAAHGEDPVVLPHAIVVDKSKDAPVVIDAEADLAVKGGLSVANGSWVKRGAGCLDITMPAGAFNWSTESQGGLSGGEPTRADDPLAAIDDFGNVTDPTLFAGMSLFDGTLRVTGAGVDRTTITVGQWNYIGNRCDSATARTRFELRNLTYRQGGAGTHFYFAFGIPAGAPLPELCLENAQLQADTLKLAQSCSTTGRPVIAVTNAEAVVSFAIQEGNGAQAGPLLLLGPGANVRSSYCVQRPNQDAGWQIYQGEIRVEDGAVMDSGRDVPICFDPAYAPLEILVRRGGAMKASAIVGMNGEARFPRGHVAFDGGRICYYGVRSRTSMLKQPDKYEFEVLEGGLEMNVANDGGYAVQTNGIRFVGSGRIRKTGAGRLVWSPRIAYTDRSAAEDYGVWNGEVVGGTTANVEGGIEVVEGAMELLDGSAPEGLSVKVDEGATLDLGGAVQPTLVLSGTGGTIVNGTLRSFKVDFGRTPEDPVEPRTAYPLVRVGAGADLGLTVGRPISVRAVNSGNDRVRRATVVLGDDGVITATPLENGAVLILR